MAIEKEIVIITTVYKELYNHIQEYRKQNPKYEIFNISISGDFRYETIYVIWKKKEELKENE